VTELWSDEEDKRSVTEGYQALSTKSRTLGPQLTFFSRPLIRAGTSWAELGYTARPIFFLNPELGRAADTAAAAEASCRSHASGSGARGFDAGSMLIFKA
jgi:hypothetical protein